ncbi:MAG: hypothetical protein ACYTXC_25090 [Nostoc sp.]
MILAATIASLRILLPVNSKILKETDECEHHHLNQTLENLHGLQTY